MTSGAEPGAAWRGRLSSIHTAAKAGAPLESHPQIEAESGRGLVGDRYYRAAGDFDEPDEESEVTLIESETLEAIRNESGIEFAPGDSRRNLVTRGVPLNHLVGRRFRVGRVVLRGICLCEPCGHLEKLTVAGARAALQHRGGLRAAIESGGMLHAGDEILPLEDR